MDQLLKMKISMIGLKKMTSKTLDMHFKTGIGYGDFVSNLGYAYNASIKYQTKVNATFYWGNDLDYRYDEQDPETLIERFFKVRQDLKHLDEVNIQIVTNTVTDYRYINHLDFRDPVSNLWFTNRQLSSENFILLWRSKFNTFFPGKEKDPIFDKWDDLISNLKSSGYGVEEVTYRTPIDEVLDLMARCRMGIGYDGMVHQLFKHYWKPLLVFCKRRKLNEYLIPQASQEVNYENFLSNSLEFYEEYSLSKIKRFRKLRNRWISDTKNFEDSEIYNKKINMHSIS